MILHTLRQRAVVAEYEQLAVLDQASLLLLLLLLLRLLHVGCGRAAGRSGLSGAARLLLLLLLHVWVLGHDAGRGVLVVRGHHSRLDPQRRHQLRPMLLESRDLGSTLFFLVVVLVAQLQVVAGRRPGDSDTVASVQKKTELIIRNCRLRSPSL